MPLKRCTKNGKQGWQWGDSGYCYVGGLSSKKLAIKQGLAEGNGKLKAEDLYYDYNISEAEIEDAIAELTFVEKVIAYISKKERDSIPDEDFGDSKNRKYPIRNQHDVESAAKLLGRAPKSKQAAIKSKIKEIIARKKLSPPKSWEKD